ncbi:MAG: acetyl-CoA carboxylase subunit alpha [Francisellaceae bacterium]|nr:acetyl-CoA carboxylase subunit alpha [Francisellaceae bacterium]
MSLNCLEFEQPISELEAKIEALRLVGTDKSINISEEIAKLQNKSQELTRSIFKNLSEWQKVQLARHPLRPYTLDYIREMFTDFDEIHGDRAFADDKAIIAGLARLDGQPVMIIGQQKGRDTKEKVMRNFGMPHPEGYRKALRVALLAERFNIPIITLIDTPGAHAGIQAEARGQSEAIAKNLLVFSKLKVPVLCVVIGEGCSGGALGIGVGDKTLMLQYAYYATISPEGCATILWKSALKASEAAEVMNITADRLLKLGLIEEIVPEPLGGAHRNVVEVAATLKKALINNLNQLKSLNTDTLLNKRYQRLISMGIRT